MHMIDLIQIEITVNLRGFVLVGLAACWSIQGSLGNCWEDVLD